MMSQREGIFNMAICKEQPIREKLAQWAGRDRGSNSGFILNCESCKASQ